MSYSKLLSKEQRAKIRQTACALHPNACRCTRCNLLAHAEAVDELLADQENEIRLTRAMLTVKEQELVAAGEFLAGAGYTGQLNHDAGKAWAFLLDSVRAQVADWDQRIKVLEAALKELIRCSWHSGACPVNISDVCSCSHLAAVNKARTAFGGKL